MRQTRRLYWALAAMIALAGCNTEPNAAPKPAQPAADDTPQIATAPPPPVSPDTTRIATPELDHVGTALGSWSMQDGNAVFGPPGGNPYFILSCDAQARRVRMARSDRRGDADRLQIVTANASATMTASIDPGPPRMVAGSLSADDMFFGALLAGDDRFGVRIDRQRTLAMPMAAALRTVIENCRRPD
ncbi:hypothetical protein [Sphingomonas sp. 37zxx]|uniref:hypothetical protein n=1 Tax=Sphingomonas sp. 37zxx TaxID=1550073 RepID=UPI00053BED10|nr:hypothetical protein [Sphingomonas sp. 37zxx]